MREVVCVRAGGGVGRSTKVEYFQGAIRRARRNDIRFMGGKKSLIDTGEVCL